MADSVLKEANEVHGISWIYTCKYTRIPPSGLGGLTVCNEKTLQESPLTNHKIDDPTCKFSLLCCFLPQW